jgi:hypothetical protein
MDRGRGSPSKEYSEMVRVRDVLLVLVASYVVSYDISSNPTTIYRVPSYLSLVSFVLVVTPPFYPFLSSIPSAL